MHKPLLRCSACLCPRSCASTCTLTLSCSVPLAWNLCIKTSSTLLHTIHLLQVIDPHTHEYMARLRDEPVLLALAQKVLDYLTRINDAKAMPKVALRLVEHLYFKVCGWGSVGEVWGLHAGGGGVGHGYWRTTGVVVGHGV